MRLAVAADTDRVRDVVRQAFQRYVAVIGREPWPMTVDFAAVVAAGHCWVAEEDGLVVGVVQLAVAADHLEVEILAVAPEAQGTGVGGRLLTFAEEWAAGRQLPEVRLCTNEAMTENLTFYPRRGYRETGRGTQAGYNRVFYAKPV